MIVCVCRNINETKIKTYLQEGLTDAEIIRKYDCKVCRKCIPDIRRMYLEHKNATMVKLVVAQDLKSCAVRRPGSSPGGGTK